MGKAPEEVSKDLDPVLLRHLLEVDARAAAAIAQAARAAAVAGAASDAVNGESANWERLLGGAPWLAPQEGPLDDAGGGGSRGGGAAMAGGSRRGASGS